MKTFIIQIQHEHICISHRLAVRTVINSVNCQLLVQLLYEKSWKDILNADHARIGQEEGGNKLRTYRRVKHNYATEQYVKIIIQKKYRSAYAKFICGVAPTKLESGRYRQNRVPVDQSLCESCDEVEDEYHVLMDCNMYRDFRHNLFNEITTSENNLLALSF